MISGVKNLRFCWALVFLKAPFLFSEYLPKKRSPHPSWPSGSIVEATLKRIRDVIVSSAGTLPKLYVSVSLPGDVLESSLAPQAGDVEWVRCQKWKQCTFLNEEINQNESGTLGKMGWIARLGAKNVVRVLHIADWVYLIFNLLGDGCLQLGSFQPNLMKLVLIQMRFVYISTHFIHFIHTILVGWSKDSNGRHQSFLDELIDIRWVFQPSGTSGTEAGCDCRIHGEVYPQLETGRWCTVCNRWRVCEQTNFVAGGWLLLSKSWSPAVMVTMLKAILLTTFRTLILIPIMIMISHHCHRRSHHRGCCGCSWRGLGLDRAPSVDAICCLQDQG